MNIKRTLTITSIILAITGGLIIFGWIYIERHDRRIAQERQLRDAAQYNDFAKIEKLVNEGVNIDAMNSKTGQNALSFALFKGNLKMIEFLLQNGAKSTAWGTPLEFAKAFKDTLSSQYDYANLIKLLEKYNKEEK